MHVTDCGILIQKRAFSENKVLLSFFTASNGRMNGIARVSRKHTIDLGYTCKITWSAKQEHQLGFIEHELLKPSPPTLLNDYPKLLALQSAASLLSQLLVDHHPYATLYSSFEAFLHALQDNFWHYAYVQFEKTLLEQLGFGLNLTQCAATGSIENLTYISPKSGCAVSIAAGAPYKEKLFVLPELLSDEKGTDMREAMHVLGYFLEKHLLEGKMPHARRMLFDLFLKDLHAKSA